MLPPFFYTATVNQEQSRPIYLVGLMGVGKSTVGPLLARRLGRTFIDSDHEIEARAGRTISTIFEEEGEASFRRLEADTIGALSEGDVVIALGGGALTLPGSLEALQERGLLVYLWAPPEVLVQRIGDPRTRPLLAGLGVAERVEKLRLLLEERHPRYSQASIQVEAAGTTHEIVKQILLALEPEPANDRDREQKERN